jgi:DnaJ-class molecular chaperone
VSPVVRRHTESEKCEKCNGTGAPLIVPGDPTSGHRLTETCDACQGSGYVTKRVQG